MVPNPPAGAEAQDHLPIEPARGGEIHILERGGIPQLRVPQALRQFPLLTRGPFRVDQQAEAVVKPECCVLTRASLLIKRRGHRGQVQRVELFDRGVCQHKPPRNTRRRADSRASARVGQGPPRRAGAGPAG